MLEVTRKLDKEEKLLDDIDNKIRKRLLQTSTRGTFPVQKKLKFRSRLTVKGTVVQ